MSNKYYIAHPRGFSNEYTIRVADGSKPVDLGVWTRISRRQALEHLTRRGQPTEAVYKSVSIDAMCCMTVRPGPVAAARMIRNGEI